MHLPHSHDMLGAGQARSRGLILEYLELRIHLAECDGSCKIWKKKSNEKEEGGKCAFQSLRCLKSPRGGGGGGEEMRKNTIPSQRLKSNTGKRFLWWRGWPGADLTYYKNLNRLRSHSSWWAKRT